uniref:Immunoglobulin I-set domain-containing protein n=1 Tax=Meloidogyne javanica TaxID=6303 RepID=A0A915MID5_MELJA
MSPPAIQGQPKIRHDEQTNSVFLEVSVLGAEATKTKWYLEEKEIASGTGAYRMSTQEQEGGKKLIICEIKNYDKSMQGTYKAVNAPEFYEKPKITQKDGGKDESPLKTDNRIKLSTEKDSSEPDGTILLLEINDPTKEDQAKYKCVVKNGEGRNEQSLNLVFD